MRRMVEKLLRQYGVEMTLDGETPVFGFLQPVIGKTEQLAAAHPGPLGLENAKRYVYIGPLEPQPVENGQISLNGSVYLVRTVQEIQGANGPVYVWGMCVEKGGDDQWGASGLSES